MNITSQENMEKKICAYTCITGDYDNLSEINNPEKNVDYLCFTNNKNIKSKTWKIIYIQNGELNDHQLSRKIKMLGHPIISKNYDISLWMDASVIWQKPITKFIEKYLKHSPFAAFKHNQRKTIQEEAVACLLYHKDTKTNILKTLAFLESEKFPDNLGLYEMTVFIKRHNDETVKKTMNLWFEINKKYSKRDQLSFMYAVWKTGLKIDLINLNIWKNNWFNNTKHNPKKTIDSIGLYCGNINDPFIIDNYYDVEPKHNQDVYSIKQLLPIDCKTVTIIFPYIPGLIISNINTKKPINKTELVNATNYYNNHIFLSSNCIMILQGNFKKDQIITFSIQLSQITFLDLIDFTANICHNNQLLNETNSKLCIENTALQKQCNSSSQIIKQLQEQNNSYAKTIKSIYNSKSWRLAQRIGKISSPFTKTNQ